MPPMKAHPPKKKKEEKKDSSLLSMWADPESQHSPYMKGLEQTEHLRISLLSTFGTAELHLSGLIGIVSHPDMQKIWILGFFFENRLHWQFEV